MENKEQLRLKLIEAWSKGYMVLALENEEDWGFQMLDSEVRYNFEDFLGINHTIFHYDAGFDAFSYSVALEISNFPLVKALA